MRSAIRRVTTTGLGLARATRSYNAVIDPSKLEVFKAPTLKEKYPLKDLSFGRQFTDHMLEIDWDAENGWHNPVIKPYGDLTLSPAAPCLHYGIECFEGMKVYKDAKGTVRLFRPEMNMKRLNHSMSTVSMPPFNGDGMIELLKKLVKMEESWIPTEDGYSVYLRPTAIGTNGNLGVTKPSSAKLYCICSPTGPYFASGFKPIKLLADTEHVRAWPGGVGNSKLGGNYGPTIAHATRAMEEKGCAQILWLFGDDHQVTEVGAMNIMFVIKDKVTGKPELITAPLTRGDILAGITRFSVLDLARDGHLGEMDVSERWLTMGEIEEAEKDGRLVESFGVGTAAIISPVNAIHYKGRDIMVPTGDDIGPIAQSIWTAITDIQYGRVEHEWSVKVE